jgi:hypothetical protein
MMRISKHYLCLVPTASKNEGCFFSQIFAFPLKKLKLEKSTPAPCCRGILPRMPMAPVDKPAAAR